MNPSTNRRRREYGHDPCYQLAATLLRAGVMLALVAATAWLVALLGNWGWLPLPALGWLGHRAAAWVRDDY